MWKASRERTNRIARRSKRTRATPPISRPFSSSSRLACPSSTLRLLIDQASRTQAIMVLRGLENASIRQTAAHVQQLIGQKQVEWLIDPQAFDRFGVNQAPTFVLVKALAPSNDCASGSCIAPNAFASIAGDVSIDYALEAIERRAPRFSPEAQLFLKRIRG